MPDHISSSMYASEMKNLDVSRLKDFVRCIVAAQRKIKEKEMARDELKKHITKVQKLAAQRSPELSSLRKSVADIENKVNTVLQKESKLLRSSAYENKTIAELRGKINELEGQLYIKDAQKDNLARFNEERIKSLSENINAMKQKVSSYIEDKSERERRMAELEEKIRRQVDVKAANARLEEIENKIRELEQREMYEEDDLSRVKQRIDMIRTKI
jgi:chromosome segregation ATPase